MQTAEREYNASVLITSNLKKIICDQEMDLSRLNKDAMSEVKNQINRIKEAAFQQEVDIISAEMDTKQRDCCWHPVRKGLHHGYRRCR